LSLSKKDDELRKNLQGNAVENYKLKHHNGDEFTWHMPQNDQVRRGRNLIAYMEYWKIKAEKIFWVIEKDLPGAGMEPNKEPTTGHSEL